MFRDARVQVAVTDKHKNNGKRMFRDARVQLLDLDAPQIYIAVLQY